MKKSELIEQWTKNVRVANSADIKEQHHSPRDISLEDAARGWLAFKELYNDGKVFIHPNFGSNNTLKAHAFYTKNFAEEDNRSLLQRFKDLKKDEIAEWAAQNPHNLLLIYRTGADIMHTGTSECAVLHKLHIPLAEQKGINTDWRTTDTEEIFNKLFHEADQQHAIDLMERTASERVYKMQGIEHS